MTNLLQDIERAIHRGLSFIVAEQDAEGSWTDWALSPNASSEWTTAYIGFRLSGLHAPFRQQVSEPLSRAARWLLAHRFPDGGWGYNPDVESDADSTALAILFLNGTRHPPPENAYDHLRRFQQQDGGFSTFLSGGLAESWGRSHAEITPVALLALQTHPGGLPDEIITRGLDWIRRTRCADGTWDAFWWSTPLPASEANLALLAALGCPEAVPPVLQHWEPDGSLQAAYLLSITIAAGSEQRMHDLARRLIDGQVWEGAWQSKPALRIPPRGCERPWDQPLSGPLFADPMSLFTTATVISALSKAHRVMTRKLRMTHGHLLRGLNRRRIVRRKPGGTSSCA
jgi:hypothetical protein